MKKAGIAGTITYGGWYQRTTLHLSEVHDLLREGTSNLPLSKELLEEHRQGLRLTEVARHAESFDVVVAQTEDGITIRFYEDGLFTLELTSSEIKAGAKKLKTYFDEQFAPALAYIFSLGAPTPRALANLPTVHPIVVTIEDDRPASRKLNRRLFGQPYQSLMTADMAVHKTPSHIVVMITPGHQEVGRSLVEQQIFFREFKDQLGKYLHIHRTIWEEIAAIKEQPKVTIKEAQKLRAKLDQYKVTVDLITNRINQMGTFVHTRARIAQLQGVQDQLNNLFQYRFEVLTNTLEYIKEIWKMTSDYLSNAIDVLSEVQGQGAKASIQSLRAITTFGVLATVIKFSWESTNLQKVTPGGVGALLGVLILAWFVDRGLRFWAENTEYKLKFKERAEKI